MGRLGLLDVLQVHHLAHEDRVLQYLAPVLHIPNLRVEDLALLLDTLFLLPLHNLSVGFEVLAIHSDFEVLLYWIQLSLQASTLVVAQNHLLLDLLRILVVLGDTEALLFELLDFKVELHLLEPG